MSTEEDSDDFFKWKEENKKTPKRNKRGLPPRSNRLVKVNPLPKRRKKYIRKSSRRSKDKVNIYSRQRELDFMKYSLIVEHWAMAQYELNREELGLLYYLYSEPYFTKKAFIDQSRLLTRKTISMFNKFIEKEIIVEIPRENKKSGKSVGVMKIYKMSFKYCNRVKAIYNRLTLHTKISEDYRKNKVFRRKKASEIDKKIANAITLMNKDIDDIKNGGKGYVDDDFIYFQ